MQGPSKKTSLVFIAILLGSAVALPLDVFAQSNDSSELVILTEDLDGEEIEGYYTILYQDDEMEDNDFSPARFNLDNDEDYVVEVHDFEEYIFDHWKDTDSSSRDREVSIDSDAELTAVYRNAEEEEDEDDEEEETEEEEAEEELEEERDEEVADEERQEESDTTSVEDENQPDNDTREEIIEETPIQNNDTTAESTTIECLDYDEADMTLEVTCDANLAEATFFDVDNGTVVQPIAVGEYLLNTNVTVRDNATMSVGGSGFDVLRIANEKGITVLGRIEIDNVTITSWDPEVESVIDISGNANVPRSYIALQESEGGHIFNSTIAFMGYNNTRHRGVDLMDGSHDFAIRNSTFHDNWFAFYSSGAYNLLIDSSVFRDNIAYAIDPHTGTYNASITGNDVYRNQDGIVCSQDCYDIVIKENNVHDNEGSGIFVSRNVTNSTISNNSIHNNTNGISISESPNNEVYGNTITNASRGVYLINPREPDDGVTTLNHIYNNTISDVENGIVARRSIGNILSDNSISNITSNHYFLTENATVGIVNQAFSDTEIRGRTGQNIVGIADSGTIVIDGNSTDTNATGFTATLTNQTVTINPSVVEIAVEDNSTSSCVTPSCLTAQYLERNETEFR